MKEPLTKIAELLGFKDRTELARKLGIPFSSAHDIDKRLKGIAAMTGYDIAALCLERMSKSKRKEVFKILMEKKKCLKKNLLKN